MAVSVYQFQAAGGRRGSPNENAISLGFEIGVYPSLASLPTDVSASGDPEFTQPTSAGAATIDRLNARFGWTSQQSGGTVNRGAQLTLGVLVRPGSAPTDVTVRLRFKVPTESDRWEGLYVKIDDKNGHSSASSNLYSSVGDDTWVTKSAAFNSLSSYDSEILYVTLNFQGTTNSANVGVTDLYVDYVVVEVTT
jgi:hypothetical protein